MSWLDDVLFAPFKWALPEEIEKKMNPVFDAVGAAGNAAIGKWDSAAADVVKIAADSCELAGKKDAAKALGKAAEGVELIGGGIIKAADKALAEGAKEATTKATADAIDVSVKVGVRTAADQAISETAKTIVVRGATAVTAGTIGAAATGKGENFFAYAKMGDALVKGDAGLASGDQIAARTFMTATGGALGGALGQREGAEAGLGVGLGIGDSLGDGNFRLAAAQVVGAGAGIAVGDKLASKDQHGNRKFNMGAFNAARGLATGSVGVGEAVVGKNVRAALEGAAGVATNALKLKAESQRAHGERPDKVLEKVFRETDGVTDALKGIATMNEAFARQERNAELQRAINKPPVSSAPLDLDDTERGA